jgi:hypothetical protein
MLTEPEAHGFLQEAVQGGQLRVWSGGTNTHLSLGQQQQG